MNPARIRFEMTPRYILESNLRTYVQIHTRVYFDTLCIPDLKDTHICFVFLVILLLVVVVVCVCVLLIFLCMYE